MLANPFFVYVLTFGGALAFYQFGWSAIYPATTLDMAGFFLLSFGVALAFARFVGPRIESSRKHGPGLLPRWVILVPSVCFLADLVHTGTIPLLDLIRGRYVYMSFSGVPSLHVFAVTFGSAFSTIRFADFLCSYGRRRWSYLLEAAVPLVYLLLIVYRGPAMIVLTSWAFVFIIERGMNAKRIGLFAVISVAVLFGAGELGKARTGSIETLGKPTEWFKKSGIPESAFWVYLYTTGPLANFQYAVSKVEPLYDVRRIPDFVVSEMLPDTLSHRILPAIGSVPDRHIPQFSPHFNVSSYYGRAWTFYGWISVMCMLTLLMFAIFIYLDLAAATPLFVPSLALLNTFIVYNVFDNMIATTSVSLQLAWPLLLWLLTGFVNRPNSIGRVSNDDDRSLAGVESVCGCAASECV
jgi:hypothetical protein